MASVKELEGKLAVVNAQREKLGVEAKALAKALDIARVEEATATQVAGMTEAQKVAMRQMLGPSGVASGEAVGVPGRAGG